MERYLVKVIVARNKLAADLIKMCAGRPGITRRGSSVEINVIVVEVVLDIIIKVLDGTPEQDGGFLDGGLDGRFFERACGFFLDLFCGSRVRGGIGRYEGHL